MSRAIEEMRECNMMNQLVEMEGNDLLSSYVAENYTRLVSESGKFVDKQFGEMLVTDVWMAFKNKESNGEGYQMYIGEQGDVISIEQVVYSTLKKYGMNSKYRVNHNPVELPTSFTEGADLDDMVAAEASVTMKVNRKLLENCDSYEALEYQEQLLDVVENLTYIISAGKARSGRHSLLTILENIVDVVESGSITTEIIDAYKRLNLLSGETEEVKDAFRSVVGIAVKDSRAYKAALVRAKANTATLQAAF